MSRPRHARKENIRDLENAHNLYGTDSCDSLTSVNARYYHVSVIGGGLALRSQLAETWLLSPAEYPLRLIDF